MTKRPPKTILICATPRTGSTLLCAMFAASGVGGRPESWYRAEDRAYYEQEWGLPRSAEGNIAPRDFLVGAIRAGSGTDGTFGLRLQAQTLAPFLQELRTVFPDAQDDADLLETALGPCQFVRVWRMDDVAQAVSRLRAEQTQVWHRDGIDNAKPVGPEHYDAAQLDAFRTEAKDGNRIWDAWFEKTGIVPAVISYEELSAASESAARGLLSEIGISLPASVALTVPNRRMADAQSTEWAARYRAERGLD